MFWKAWPLLALNVSIDMNRQISPSTFAVTYKAPDQALGISEAIALWHVHQKTQEHTELTERKGQKLAV